MYGQKADVNPCWRFSGLIHFTWVAEGKLGTGRSCTLSALSVAICEKSGFNRRNFSGPGIGFGAFGANSARGQLLFVRLCFDVLLAACISASVLKRAARLDSDPAVSAAVASATVASLTIL